MAARKKSTSDVVHDEDGRFGGNKPVADGWAEARALRPATEAEQAVDGALRAAYGEASDRAKAEFHGTPGDDVVPGLQPDPIRPTITKLQLHTRAHILGIQGTSDSLVVGDVIESIEPDMLGPIAGFVVRLKRGAPVFMPQASVLAVTVVG